MRSHLPISKPEGPVGRPRRKLLPRFRLQLGALVLLYTYTLLASASVGSYEMDSKESSETTGEGLALGWGSAVPSLEDGTFYDSSWSSEASLSSNPEAVRTSSKSPDPAKRRPARKGSWPKKAAAGLFGFVLFLVLCRGLIIPRAIVARQLDDEPQVDVFANRFKSLYSGSVDFHKAQQESMTLNVARLENLANDAAELVKHLEMPEANKSLERLRKSIQDAKDAAGRIRTAFRGDFSTIKANEVATTTYARATLDLQRRYFENAINEAKRLQRLAGRFIAEVGREAEALIVSIKDHGTKLTQLSQMAQALPSNKTILAAHIISVSSLCRMAAIDLAAVESLSAGADIGGLQSPVLSLLKPTAAVQRALQLRSRIREAATEAADWMEEGEAAARAAARNAGTALYMQMLKQRHQMEVSRFVLKPAPIPDEHVAGVQKYLSTAELLDKFWEEIGEEHAKMSSTTSAMETIECSNRISSLITEAGSKLLHAPLVTNSLVDVEAMHENPPSEMIAFDGVRVQPLPHEEETDAGFRRTSELKTTLGHIAELSVKGSRIPSAGTSWDPPTEVPEWAQRSGIQNSCYSHQLKTAWLKDVESVNFLASSFEKSRSQLLKAQDRPAIISATEETIFLSSLVTLRAQKALSTSLDGRAWKLFEQSITDSWNQYQMARAQLKNPPDESILNQHGLSEDAFISCIKQIYEKRTLGVVAIQVGELREKVRLLEELARTEEDAATRDVETPEVAVPPLQPAVAATQETARAAAKAASEVVARVTVQTRMLASKAAEWHTKIQIPETQEAALATQAVTATIENCTPRFQSACEDLERASTDSKLREALLEVMNIKEEIMQAAHTANFVSQMAALAIHEGNFFRQIWEPEDGKKTRSNEPQQRGMAELEIALNMAMQANELHEQLVNRALQELWKAPPGDPEAFGTKYRLHREAEIASGFVRQIKKLIGKASTQENSDRVDELLVAEARSCADMIMESALFVDSLVYNLQNALDAAPIAQQSFSR